MRIASVCFAALLFVPVASPLCMADEGKSDLSSSSSSSSAGVEDLAFGDFYVMPIGPLGLEPTSKLRSFGGKRVRVIGYMVHEEEATAGVFMLAPRPVQLAEVADGPADDLPATTVFVHVPAEDRKKIVPFRPGPWTVTGTLELGAQTENDGRMSYTRLKLDSTSGGRPGAQADEEQSSRRPRS